MFNFYSNLAKSCSLGKVYTDCASSCQLTCNNKNQDTGLICSSECSVGCQCPAGQYVDLGKNGTCVPEKECSCNYKGKYYQSGESINVDCNKW